MACRPLRALLARPKQCPARKAHRTSAGQAVARRSAETDGAYFSFEVTTTPGFGPPLHTHDYRELFYVLEGSYEFTFQRGDKTETIVGAAGTCASSARTR